MVLANAIGMWLVSCEGLPFLYNKTVRLVFHDVGIFFVYSNVGKIGKVVCGSEGAYFLKLHWVFYRGLGFYYCLDF